MAQIQELTPDRFNLPAPRWSEAPQRIGTVVVPHTLALDRNSHRRTVGLTGATDVLRGSRDDIWTGIGITHPTGWDTGKFPIDDDTAHWVIGVNRLSEATAGNNTVFRKGTLGELAVGLATYYTVGPNAKVVTIEPNPDFNADLARQYVDAQPWQFEGVSRLDLNATQKRLLEEADFDPARYLAASLSALTSSDTLYLGTREVDGSINSLSHDLVLPFEPVQP